MTRFRSFPRPYAAENHIVRKIPQEIADSIFSLLTAQDQICFSLSCKHLFACLHLYLKTQEQGIQFSQLVPRERRLGMLIPCAQMLPGIQLLLRLENDRWKFCRECWSLHPHSTWRALQANGRMLLRQVPSDYHQICFCETCYLRYAGEVDICPCMTITFRDKLFLIEKCRQVMEPTAEGRRKYFQAFDDQPNFGTVHGGIWHVCSFTDYLCAKVKVITVFMGSFDGTSLYVSNRYRFTFRRQRQPDNIDTDIDDNSSSHQTLTTPWLACSPPSPKSSRAWLEKFFHEEAGSSFLGWDKKDDHDHHRFSRPSISYHRGKLNGAVEEKCPLEPQPFEMTIARNLGNDKWPNKGWNHNRRK
jgi:hypothetical protein